LAGREYLQAAYQFRILREAGLIVQYNHGNRSELTLRKADLEVRFPDLLDLVASSEEQAG
jgi:hypothetical protein